MRPKMQRIAMAGIFNLAHVFKLIVDRLNQRTFSQQNPVFQLNKPVFHILTDTCDELEALLKELFKQALADVAFVAKKFAPQALDQSRHGVSVIHIAQCQAKAQQFTAVIDD